MNTKSNTSPTKPLSLSSPLLELMGNKSSKTCQKLGEAGIKTVEDLIWILPLRLQKIPPVRPFAEAKEGELFKGEGKIVHFQARPNFWAKGKRGVLLYSINLHVQDLHSSELLFLKWFNTYASVSNKLKDLEKIIFAGTVQVYQGQRQIINPDYDDLAPSNTFEYRIQYPTVNKLAPVHLKKIFQKITPELWAQIDETLPPEVLSKRDLFNRQDSFKILHGQKWPCDEKDWKIAQNRLIYEEFFFGQLKVHLRRKYFQFVKAPVIESEDDYLTELLKFFPYTLTDDQMKTVGEIRKDLARGFPMMRLVQGDVGCGKTVVAFIAAMCAIKKGHQVAMMCPTESLAYQHFIELSQITAKAGVHTQLILGSTPAAEKKQIQKR
ncbi:MAG: DEAD/DEAH box helicase, partial [Pseudomonadota bacterium]